MLICHDKAAFDKEAAKRFLSRRLKRNYYFLYREWPYKEIKPRIFAERYLVPSGSGWEDERLLDYKFFCFNGVPKIMYISADKDPSSPIDFFDMAFNRLDLRLDSPRFAVPPEKPAAFEEMQSLAAKLSAGIPHIRVDFYFCGGNVYVGELTFFHSAGFKRIHPSAWNDTLGSWIDLRGVLT